MQDNPNQHSLERVVMYIVNCAVFALSRGSVLIRVDGIILGLSFLVVGPVACSEGFGPCSEGTPFYILLVPQSQSSFLLYRWISGLHPSLQGGVWKP